MAGTNGCQPQGIDAHQSPVFSKHGLPQRSSDVTTALVSGLSEDIKAAWRAGRDCRKKEGGGGGSGGGRGKARQQRQGFACVQEAGTEISGGGKGGGGCIGFLRLWVLERIAIAGGGGGEGEERRERQQHSSRLRSAGRLEHILRESVIYSTSYLRVGNIYY